VVRGTVAKTKNVNNGASIVTVWVCQSNAHSQYHIQVPLANFTAHQTKLELVTLNYQCITRQFILIGNNLNKLITKYQKKQKQNKR
jgi:hypothetical protein